MKRRLHDCQYTFIELATNEFPKYLADLNEAVKKAHKPREFLDGRLAHVKKVYGDDFRGCYVFIEGKKVVYVGISRTVLKRILQHMDATGPNTSNVAFKIAHKMSKKKMKRRDWNSEEFRETQERAVEKLRRWKLAWIPIKNPLELYLFEAFACMEFNTNDYNSFETH